MHSMIGKKIKYISGDKEGIILICETDENQNLVVLDQAVIFKDDNYIEHFVVRPEIALKLYQASKKLPKEWHFKVFEGFRSNEKQNALWENEKKRIKKENPLLSEEEVVEIANLGIANPNYLGSGHQTGGAVDITICDEFGKELDMGTSYLDTTNPKTVTDANGLTPLQYKNRYMLKSLLESVGLINYPLEWWHFSFGEQEWAVLTNQKRTLYAPILQMKVLTKE